MYVRTQFFPLAILLAFTQSIFADIAVYTFKGSSTTTGGGVRATATVNGSLAIDLNTFAATSITVVTVSVGGGRMTYFTQTPRVNYLRKEISGPRGQTLTVFAKAESPGTQYAGIDLMHDTVIGTNSSATIRTFPARVNWILPKALNSTAANLMNSDTIDFLTQGSGIYSLDSATTIKCNNLDQGVEAYIETVRSSYQKRGIQEFTLDPAQ
jgi:hypothetical protein